MKVRYRKGIANHPDPESCGGAREDAIEALTGESAGQPLSREIRQSGAPTLLSEAEGHTDEYPTGVKVDDATMAALRLTPDEFHGEWNYAIASAEPAQLRKQTRKLRAKL